MDTTAIPKKVRFFRRISDFLYGYDFFISYTRQHKPGSIGGENYAARLCQKLETDGFKCFFDSKDYAAGDAWKGIGARKLRMTSQLIVVASEMALEAPAVVREIQVFSEKDSARIIPIDFGGSVKKRDSSKPAFQYLADDILFIEEEEDRLPIGPSDATVSRLKAGFNLTRQDSKRARAFAGAALIFMFVGLVAIAAGLIALRNADKAKANELIATRNLVRSHVIQGSENADQGRKSEAVSYLGAALRLSNELPPQGDESIRQSLISLMASGRFSPLVDRVGHPGIPVSACFSKTGKYLMTTCDDGMARLWNFNYGNLALVGNPIPHASISGVDAEEDSDNLHVLNSLSFSQNESLVALASGKTVEIRNTEDGAVQGNAMEFPEPVEFVAFGKNEDFLLVLQGELGEDSTLKIVNTSTRKIVRSIPVNIICPMVSPEANWALVNRQLLSLSPPFGMKSLPYEEEAAFTLRMRFFLNDRFACVETSEGIDVLEIDGMKQFGFVDKDSGEINTSFSNLNIGSFSVGNKGEFLHARLTYALTGEGYGQRLAAFRFPEQSEADLASRSTIINGVRDLENTEMQLSPSGHQLACRSGRGTIQIRDTSTNDVISDSLRHPSLVTKVIFSPDEKFVITLANDNFLRVWRTDLLRDPSGEKSVKFPQQSSRWIPNMLCLDAPATRYDDSGGEFVTVSDGSGKRSLTFHNPESGESSLILSGEAGKVISELKMGVTSCYRLGFSGHGGLFYALTHDESEKNATHVGDTSNGAMLFATNDTWVGADPTDLQVMLAKENSFKIVRASNGKIISQVLNAGGIPSCAAFSPDGQLVACGFQGETLNSAAWAGVWNIKTGTRISIVDHGTGWDPVYLEDQWRLFQGSQFMKEIAFSKDSRYIATFSGRSDMDNDSSFMGWQPRRSRLWEVASGRPVGEWLQVNGHHNADEEEVASIRHPDREAAHYVRSMSINFEASGKALDFTIGDTMLQKWSLDSEIKTDDLLDLAEVLSGYRYDSSTSRLDSIPEDDRIRRWRILAKKQTVVNLLELPPPN